MISYWYNSADIKQDIYIPKYYDPEISESLSRLSSEYELLKMEELVNDGILTYTLGNEIGKKSYGTGNIPFVRTSDISNWEIKTTPKQGVSEDIYNEYAPDQDVREGDILLVRDGTYLVGTNCFITHADSKLLFQSHLLKFRIKDKEKLPPELFFLALNSPIVQRQIRSVQFTADIIDTIGNRFLEITLPIPKASSQRNNLTKKVRSALRTRVRGKCFVKQAPLLIEQSLSEGNVEPFEQFLELSEEELRRKLIQDTTTLEFGTFEATTISSSQIIDDIYLPKYYDPEINEELNELKDTCDLVSIGDLNDKGSLKLQTGDEVGKMAYGTGNIPFFRTSDFANWEIKHDPKHAVSEDIYEQYSETQNLSPLDILLVRDGTYLVGSSTIVFSEDAKSLYCGGLYRIRTTDHDYLSPYLLLGLLNSYVVKRQIRSKQFTRDVIDTLGRRIHEVFLPIPRESELRDQISRYIEHVLMSRYEARNTIYDLAMRISPDSSQ